MYGGVEGSQTPLKDPSLIVKGHFGPAPGQYP